MSSELDNNRPHDRYLGYRTIDGLVVTVNGKALPLYRELADFADGEIEWGYEGDAPLQLAFALVMSRRSDKDLALRIAKPLMVHIVSQMANEWELSGGQLDEIIVALRHHRT